MLFLENARRQGRFGVVIENSNRPLNHDRSIIQFGSDEVHTGAGDLHAMIQRLTLRTDSWKRRKERRVDVQNGVWKCLEQRSTHQSHVSGQTNQPDVTRQKFANNGFVMIPARGRLTVINAQSFDTGAASNLQPFGVRTIGNNHGDRRVKTPVADGSNQRLEIASSTRNDHAQSTVHTRFT